MWREQRALRTHSALPPTLVQTPSLSFSVLIIISVFGSHAYYLFVIAVFFSAGSFSFVLKCFDLYNNTADYSHRDRDIPASGLPSPSHPLPLSQEEGRSDKDKHGVKSLKVEPCGRLLSLASHTYSLGENFLISEDI